VTDCLAFWITLPPGLARPLNSAVPAIGYLRYDDLVLLAGATLLLPSVLACPSGPKSDRRAPLEQLGLSLGKISDTQYLNSNYPNPHLHYPITISDNAHRYSKLVHVIRVTTRITHTAQCPYSEENLSQTPLLICVVQQPSTAFFKKNSLVRHCLLRPSTSIRCPKFPIPELPRTEPQKALTHKARPPAGASSMCTPS